MVVIQRLFLMCCVFISLDSIASDFDCSSLLSRDGIQKYKDKLHTIGSEYHSYIASLDVTTKEFYNGVTDKRAAFIKSMELNCLNKNLILKKLITADTEILLEQFNLLNELNFYVPNKVVATRMYEIFQTLEKNGYNASKIERDIVESLIAARLWREAKDVSKNYHLEIAIPNIVNAMNKKRDDRVLMKLIARQNTLNKFPLNWQKGGQIIVIGHPNCHFTRNAVSKIVSDERLNDIFSKYAVWLLPVTGKLDIDDV